MQKTYWYQDGDLNTKFFNASATTRKKVNRIVALEAIDATRVTNDIGMCHLARE